MTMRAPTLAEQRSNLSWHAVDKYRPDAFPGSKAYMLMEKSEVDLASFDKKHPEIVSEARRHDRYAQELADFDRENPEVASAVEKRHNARLLWQESKKESSRLMEAAARKPVRRTGLVTNGKHTNQTLQASVYKLDVKVGENTYHPTVRAFEDGTWDVSGHEAMLKEIGKVKYKHWLADFWMGKQIGH